MVKKKKSTKKRKPKGKRLSEVLARKEAERLRAEQAEREDDLGAAEAAEAAEADEVVEAAEADALASEPPPAFAFDEQGEIGGPAPVSEEELDWERADDGQEGQDSSPEADESDSDAPPSEGDERQQVPEDDEDDEDDEDEAAAQMGHRRYIIAGFFGLWMVVSYIFGRTLQAGWSKLASKEWFFTHLPQIAAVPHEGALVSRESLSLLLGGVLAAALVLRYYFRPDIRVWSDEVAAELTQVKWPTRKEVGNHTVVVLVASTVLTVFLALLDRVWSFVTNLIYSVGA